jgi:hypothetical protein
MGPESKVRRIFTVVISIFLVVAFLSVGMFLFIRSRGTGNPLVSFAYSPDNEWV